MSGTMRMDTYRVQAHVGDYGLSGGQKQNSYSATKAYSQSKLAQIMFAATMNQISVSSSSSRDVAFFAVHPGNAMTHVTRTLSPIIQNLYTYLSFLLTPEQGARSTVYAATAPMTDIQGMRTDTDASAMYACLRTRR